MSRAGDIEHLYRLLRELQRKVGGFRRLSQCDGRSGWPDQGVYFFFEDTEPRADASQLRVVRVGTHAVSGTSTTTLWHRLAQHRGTVAGTHPGGGNHRGSVFRLHVGATLIRREQRFRDLAQSWGGNSSATPAIRQRESVLEGRVSQFIREMPFLWLAVPGPPGAKSHRKIIEAAVIGLLSNRSRDAIDPPSSTWLGHWAANPAIRESGLWNVDHVSGGYDTVCLDILARYVRATPAEGAVQT
jgi:hypothetical protein